MNDRDYRLTGRQRRSGKNKKRKTLFSALLFR